MNYSEAEDSWKSNDEWRFADKEAAWKFFFAAGKDAPQKVISAQCVKMNQYENIIFELRDQLAKAEQRVAEAERDASRYRFLRDTCEMTRSFRMKGEFKNEDGDLTEYEWNSGPSAIYFDKSIDAEMARLNGASS